ncbi:dihydrodipicolinate synthase [Magnetococcus marinus MC-1]|uniref:4-hydroxy-tetrahydrodipicolinate synthase n=1 Tax=Magnetococcus marinus (strain ATCC BAA-1437 / JCM 17883 / MC-1) TaxID=156889 RepID=DAPA_MAGMM|nr:4-hydroxy-tetrahydrodipicolinate synthase [Magnetococcus marinus]A0LDB5.1 RecName: Full=4-hydroxy-tetrahydrodipicolinate synthase; Short=HTPA synthase [Magnetococcus marinus MC-1]ABK45958.1 dihydrodipicolinate synthase [Magnetococcus marinus MC-1]
MFKGVYTALITPFKNRAVDYTALAKLVEQQINGGIHGLVPCGTTGESATLSHEEHKAVIRTVVELVQGRVKVLAGTGSNCTEESTELTCYAEEVGADGALLITPYYNKPTQAGLIAHYTTVANHTKLPVVLYNVPGRTAVDMHADTVIALSKVSNIVAIKEATGNMERASQIHKGAGSSMTLISGDDATFLPFLSVGGQGVISVTTNLAPRLVRDLWDLWHNGQINEAREVHEQLLEINGLLFCETSPIPVKAGAAMLGLCHNELRLPMTAMSEANQAKLHRAMVKLNLLEE